MIAKYLANQAREQQQFTMRKGTLTSISSRQHIQCVCDVRM